MGIFDPTRREAFLNRLHCRVSLGRVFGGHIVKVVAIDDVPVKLDIVVLLAIRMIDGSAR